MTATLFIVSFILIVFFNLWFSKYLAEQLCNRFKLNFDNTHIFLVFVLFGLLIGIFVDVIVGMIN